MIYQKVIVNIFINQQVDIISRNFSISLGENRMTHAPSSSTRKQASTYGSARSHLLRRLIHLCQVFYPLIYYYYGHEISQFIHAPLNTIILILLALIVILEAIRLALGITFYGQRQHESKQISSFAWSAISICLVLLFAPGKEYGIPIIWGCALGDPLMGELRRFGVRSFNGFIIGVIFLLILWLFCAWWLGISWWFSIIMAPVIVAVEWPNIKWLDDNATMQLVPLLIVVIYVNLPILAYSGT